MIPIQMFMSAVRDPTEVKVEGVQKPSDML